MKTTSRAVFAVIGIVFLALLSCSANAQSTPFAGAWVQVGAKWKKPPATLHLNERYAECAILYFAPDHDFALIYGTVIRGPHSEVLSHGDGRVVYLGVGKRAMWVSTFITGS